MAAETSGRFRRIFLENWVESEVSLGRTWENAGTNNTSSKVSALPSRRIGMAPKTRLYPRPSVQTLPPGMAGAALQKGDIGRLRLGRATPCGATLESMDLHLKPKHVLLALAGWSLAFSAAAQWQWIDKDGRKVFSDRPPTSEIKDKDILKKPGGRAPAPMPAEAGDAAASPAPATAANKPRVDPNAPKISGKDSELQAKKKKLDEEAAARKKADDDKFAEVQADNCDRAKKSLATFQSGARVSATNAKGEREIMDDAAKAVEIRRMQGIVERDCK
ncbi:MAG: DUF4124 domain-containing protein [Polaromonas sp.]|nr:DUF4124 domain-containing protein [Polaromonas sp.]